MPKIINIGSAFFKLHKIKQRPIFETRSTQQAADYVYTYIIILCHWIFLYFYVRQRLKETIECHFNGSSCSDPSLYCRNYSTSSAVGHSCMLHLHLWLDRLRSGFSTANQTPISLIADQHGKMISDQARCCFSIANQCLIIDQISRQFDSPLFANQLVDCRSTMADVQSFFFNFSTL